VTGVGIVSPVGIGKDAFWKSLTEGRSGISRITRFDTSKLSVQVGGEVKDFDPRRYVDEERLPAMGRSTQFAIAAAKMAVEDAGLEPRGGNDSPLSLIVGTSSPPADSIEEQLSLVHEQDSCLKAHPHALAAIYPHSPTAEVSNALRLFGSTSTISTACASGCNAIGAGLIEIRTGREEMVLAGAAESVLAYFTFIAYISTGLLAENTDMPPERIMRPFDKKRHGGVVSEGAAFVMLEELEHARARGARIYAELAGYSSQDRFRGSMRTLPIKQGMVNAMRAVLRDARMPPSEVDCICANGVSSPILDKMETLALKEIFGDYAYRLPVSSIRSMIGIPTAAATPMQLIAALLSFQTDIIPPTINYENPDPDCDLDYVPNTARVNRVNVALLNNHALDGSDAALVARRHQNSYGA
jgi:3-oxoacyl-[acyl-carrier-protein] synthase II